MEQVFELGGEVVEPSLVDNLMRLIAEGAGEDDEAADTELRAQAVSSYMKLLDKPKLPDVLLQVALPRHHCVDKGLKRKVSASCAFAQLLRPPLASQIPLNCGTRVNSPATDAISKAGPRLKGRLYSSHQVRNYGPYA